MFSDALREVRSIWNLYVWHDLSLRGRESVPFLHPFKICLIGDSAFDQNVDVQKRLLASLDIPQHIVPSSRLHIDWRLDDLLLERILLHNRFVVETFLF